MRRRITWWAAISAWAALLLFPVALLAQNYFGDPDDGQADSKEFAATRAICRSVKNLKPPASDLPTPAEVKSLKACSAETAYYGFGEPQDFRKARLCAIAQMQKDQIADPFQGEGILMSIYANGYGVKRDLSLATHMACAMWNPAIDSDALVQALQELEKTPSDRPFDYCYGVSPGISGQSMRPCLELQFLQTEKKRNAERRALMAAWTAQDKAAFAKVDAAANAFLEQRGEKEGPAGTMNRGAGYAFDRDLGDQQVVLLRRLSQGSGPRATPQQRSDVDREMNIFYRKLLPQLRTDNGGMVDITRSGVRDTQRAWLPYRDAWLEFVAAKWPNASIDGVAVLLTRQRLHHLHCDGYMGAGSEDYDPKYEKECG